jgi:chitinase
MSCQSKAHFFAPLLLGALLSLGCVDSDPASGFGAEGDGDDSAGDGDGDGNTVDEKEGRLSACGVPAMTSKVVLGYMPSWSDFPRLTQALDLDTLTHVALAFTNPTAAGNATELAWVEDEHIHALVDLAHAKGVKVIASIGGAAESEAVHAAIQPNRVDDYVEELAGYLDKFNLDGVDVDIEGNSVDQTYAPFVTKLAARIRPEGKLITAAVAQWFQDAVVDEALYCFDFINEMSYDAAGGWSGPGDHSSRALARNRALYWSSTRQYPDARIVIGVPFYGYCWGSGCPRDGFQISFRNIAELYPERVHEDWIVDEEADVTISLNGTATIEHKAEFSQQYGGIMIWDLNQDDSAGQLFEAMKLGL